MKRHQSKIDSTVYIIKHSPLFASETKDFSFYFKFKEIDQLEKGFN